MNHRKLLKTYQSDGYVALKGFMPQAELDVLLTHVDRFISDVVPDMPAEHVFYEDKDDPSTLKQLQEMGTYDPWFNGQFTKGPFRQIAEILLCGPVVPKNMQYFNKPPAIGQSTPPHQDGYYFMLDPCEALTMWFALEDVDEESGCVRYVKGSHKRGMREHGRTQTLGFSQGIVDYPTPEDAKGELAFPAQPGDLLAHDALTIHRADRNRSATRTRRALGFIYYSERAQEDHEAHEAYQRKLVEEMTLEGKLQK
jgi:phytanoyl-CoA hydroxylase